LVIAGGGQRPGDRRNITIFARGLDFADRSGALAASMRIATMSDTHGSVSRRQFCAGACQLASCATLATFVSACSDGSSPTSPSGGGASMLPVLAGRFTTGTSVVTVNTAGTALGDVGNAALVESTAGVFLLARTASGTFQAIDAVCSHEGCTITGIDGSTYVCPCHGSRYNRSGQVQAGPARANLRQYATTFAEGSGVVTIAL
jgi:Rieske Fe-S protein